MHWICLGQYNHIQTNDDKLPDTEEPLPLPLVLNKVYLKPVVPRTLIASKHRKRAYTASLSSPETDIQWNVIFILMILSQR